MSFIGALLGAAPTVLGGIAKGKKDLEATTYQRQQEADQSALNEQARQQALAQSMQQFKAQEADRALSRDLLTAYRNRPDIKVADTEGGMITYDPRKTPAGTNLGAHRAATKVISEAGGQTLVNGGTGASIAKYGARPVNPIILPGMVGSGDQSHQGFVRIDPRGGAAQEVGGAAPIPKSASGNKASLALDLLPGTEQLAASLSQYHQAGHGQGGLLQGLRTIGANAAAVPGHGITGTVKEVVGQLTPDEDLKAFRTGMRIAENMKAVFVGNRAFEDTQAQTKAMMTDHNILQHNLELLRRVAAGHAMVGGGAPGHDLGGPDSGMPDLEYIRAANRTRRQ